MPARRCGVFSRTSGCRSRNRANASIWFVIRFRTDRSLFAALIPIVNGPSFASPGAYRAVSTPWGT